MHPPTVRAEALALVAEGLNDCEVARRMGLPRETVRYWRRPSYERKTRDTPCPRCWRFSSRRIEVRDADYSELLGLYLGDGHIVRTGRTDRLRIFLDVRYQDIVSDAIALLRRTFPEHGIGLSHCQKGTTAIVSLYCSHLRCLFPQAGSGRKYERRIELEDWQMTILEREPWAFLRGCIRSDGCVFVNRTGRYSYLSYDFKNLSADILGLFTHACELVGAEYRAYPRHARIYRRASVALFAAHVGAKT
jgi:hypothetical protein